MKDRTRYILTGLYVDNKDIEKAAKALKTADRAGICMRGKPGWGDLFAPLGPLTEDDAVEVFVEQMEGLKEGGADGEMLVVTEVWIVELA